MWLGAPEATWLEIGTGSLKLAGFKSASFGRPQLPLKGVIKLSAGSMVELNRSVAGPVEVIVNNCVIARGEVVVIEGNYGFCDPLPYRARLRCARSQSDPETRGFRATDLKRKTLRPSRSSKVHHGDRRALALLERVEIGGGLDGLLANKSVLARETFVVAADASVTGYRGHLDRFPGPGEKIHPIGIPNSGN